MFIRELRVECLRAIRTAIVRLDASTTIIGENDSGKGSLLRALELVLGTHPTPLAPDDIDRTTGGATAGAPCITLTFEERVRGEWDAAWHVPFLRHLPPSQPGVRRLRVLASGEASSTGWRLRFEAPDAMDAEACQALVSHARATTPLIRLAGGALTGHLDDAMRRALPEPDTAERETSGGLSS